MESGIEEEGWEIVDYYPNLQYEQEGGEKSRLGWVMDAGMKVVITGVVVSSIPLFLPPLVVISALGLAFSVPYGVVFASYACTQKLMTKLLPPPSHGPDEFEAEDIKEIDNEYDEIGRDILEIDDDVVKNVEVAQVGGVDEQVEEEKRLLEEQGDEQSFDVIITEDMKQGENEKFITETKTGEKDEKGTEDLLQGKNEEIVTQTKDDKGEENGAIDEERVQKENEKIISEGEKNEQVEKMKKETGKRRKKKKDGGKRTEGENVEPGKVIAVEEGTTPAEKVEMSSVAIEDDSGVTVFETTTIEADGKGTELKEDKEDNAGLPSEDQEAFRDEKIWEKIDAIRGITGFKAPRRESYYEELKALYLFTGIEAPATSPGTPAADFVEFYSKLCFLMSVIGVK